MHCFDSLVLQLIVVVVNFVSAWLTASGCFHLVSPSDRFIFFSLIPFRCSSKTTAIRGTTAPTCKISPIRRLSTSPWSPYRRSATATFLRRRPWVEYFLCSSLSAAWCVVRSRGYLGDDLRLGSLCHVHADVRRILSIYVALRQKSQRRCEEVRRIARSICVHDLFLIYFFEKETRRRVRLHHRGKHGNVSRRFHAQGQSRQVDRRRLLTSVCRSIDLSVSRTRTSSLFLEKNRPFP